MRDRTLGVIFTILVIFLFGIPGVACMCLGLSGFLFSGGLNSQGISYGWTTAFGATGLCIGFFLVLITIVISYLLLHRKPEPLPVKAVEPIPSQSTDKPAPPTNPDEPLPPTI